MIPRWPGWTRDEHHDDVLALTHRDGPTAGVIRYRERVRPLRGFDELLAHTLAALPGLTDVRATDTEHFHTLESEPAAIAFVEGRIDGAPVALVLAAVFGDDFYARTVGRATRPERFDELRRTV